MAPEKIGRYEIRAELGRGGMATVYQGYDPRFERDVAVKVLPSELLHSDPQFKLRFEREAKIIAQLEHPSIVPVYDVGDEGGQPYFVMRYMNGLSLSEKIKAKTLTIEETVKILGQIAPGLDEAHSKGIVHRDLKPSNILFDSKGTPYISDFGIAKLSQAQSSNVTGSGIIGTPAYMAPEQASGETVDGRSDIYAFGIILFEMLTGRQPYEADTPMGIAIKHITDPVPEILIANPSLPPEVDEIIKTAMAKNKDDRFATAVDMVDALRAVSVGQKPQFRTMAMKKAAPETMVASTKIAGRDGKKGFNVWAVIIPVLLLVIVGGGYIIYNRANRPVETEAPIIPPIVDTATTEPTPRPTDTSVVVPPAEGPTDTPVPVTDTPAAPQLPERGGADKIAFVANNEIHLMNVDGSELVQVSSDGATKNDLQWIDHDTLLFLSGTTVKFYTVSTDALDTLTSFTDNLAPLDAFQVSHDGTKVIIARNNEVFVVPFDFERMAGITSRRDLISMEDACIIPTQKDEDPRGYSRLQVKEARWSSDDQLVAWLFKGVSAGNASVQAEQVSVFNITACQPNLIDQLHNFPGTSFIPVGYANNELPDFDWNGSNLFAFVSLRRNDVWGEFYVYDWRAQRPTHIIPISGECCYSDIRWSPDGSYIFFAFQAFSLGAEAQSEFYYVPAGQMETGANFMPLELPDDFIFRDRKESPQAALRPVQR